MRNGLYSPRGSKAGWKGVEPIMNYTTYGDVQTKRLYRSYVEHMQYLQDITGEELEIEDYESFEADYGDSHYHLCRDE